MAGQCKRCRRNQPDHDRHPTPSPTVGPRRRLTASPPATPPAITAAFNMSENLGIASLRCAAPSVHRDTPDRRDRKGGEPPRLEVGRTPKPANPEAGGRDARPTLKKGNRDNRRPPCKRTPPKVHAHPVERGPGTRRKARPHRLLDVDNPSLPTGAMCQSVRTSPTSQGRTRPAY